jgi:hypothetical protein
VAGAAFAALAAALYLPVLRELFLFEPPAPWHMLGAVGLGAGTILWFDLVKVVRRRSRRAVAAA